MERPRGLVEMGVTLNAPYLGAWADKIGRFILNFGSIELLSYQQLVLLESTHEEFLRNVERTFGQRADRIRRLLSDCAGLTGDEKASAVERWDEASEFAKWRNRIAHNPVLPTWKEGSSADRDPPDLLGIPDVRQLKNGMTSNSIPIELMEKMIDHSADLAQRLHEVSTWLRRVT